MAEYISPIVDIKEEDLTTTVAAVSTNIAVAVLRNTWKGPEKKKQIVNNVDELISYFGQPTSTAACYRDMLTTAAALVNLDTVYCTRVMPTSASFAGTKMPSGNGITATQFTTNNALILSNMSGEDPDNFGDYTVSDSAAFWFIAATRGAWGNRIRLAIIDKTTQDLILARNATVTGWTTYADLAAVDVRLTDDSEFLVLVQHLPQGKTNIAANWETVEVFAISSNTDQTDDQGKNIFAENIINQESEYIRVSVGASYVDESFTCATSAWQTFAGGADNAGDSVTDANIQTAFDLYENAEEIDINLFIDSDKSETVKQYIATMCATRLDCMAILDCKYEHVVSNIGDEVSDLIDWRRGLGSFTTDNLNISTSYAALYGNWAEVYDKWNQKYRWIPLSGHVAGVYAYTDSSRDAWIAPAGPERGKLSNIRRLAFNPKLGDRNLMYNSGINPIVSFAGQGKLVWGQKNLYDRTSNFNRVNVRRLFIVLEKAISTASRYFLFEPNNAFTRISLVDMIEPYLREVKSRDGIYNYAVVCDATNNTQQRIANGQLWCDIYVQPVIAAEYIILTFIATKQGASFTEIQALRSA